MKISKILIALLLIILTIGAASASDNATDADTPQIENESVIISDDAPAKQENMSTPATGNLDSKYNIFVEEEYLKDSETDSTFSLYLESMEYMGGNLELFIDDELKYSIIPALKDPITYEVFDEHYLDTLNLSFGTHKAEFKYSGDPLFKAFDETRYFNYTYLKVDYMSSEIHGYWHVYVTSVDANGKLKIVFDNKTVYDKKFTGAADRLVSRLRPGTHTYDIYYTGDGKYKSIHRHGTFNVTYPFNAYFKEEQSGKIPITEKMLRIIVPEDAKSNVTVFVNNKTYSVLPHYAAILTNLKMGENIINVTYGDKKYPEQTLTLNITVIPDLEFTYLHSRYLKNYEAKAKLILSKDAKGTLIVKVDNKVYTRNLINGEAEIPMFRVKPGLHNFQINYTGDYEEYFRNRTIENVYLYEEYRGSIYIDEDEVSLYIPEGENGTLTIKINDKTETIHVEDDYEYPLDLKEGIWSIKVTYEGKKTILKESKTIDTTTQKYFRIDCKDYYLKDDQTKKATVYSKDSTSKKGITAYIDNKKVKMGKFGDIELSKLKPGTHTLKVVYRNAKNVVLESTKKKFTIAGYSNPTFTLKDTSSVESNVNPHIDLKVSNRLSLQDNTTLVMDMDLKGKVGGKVTVYRTYLDDFDSETGDPFTEMLVGKYKSFKISNGKARITIPTKLFKSFFGLRLSISLNDGNEMEKTFVTTFKPKIAHPDKMIYGENKTLTIYVPAPDNTTIGMFGNFKPVYSKIINGKAEFSLSALPIGDSIPAKFVYVKKSSGYLFRMLDVYWLKMTVKDQTDKINMIYGDGTVYSLDVAKIYGKTVKPGEKVKFKIGKKTIAVKINKKGIAKLKIPNSIKPGKYTLKAAYKGGKIIKTLTIKHVVSLKSVKIKKYAKKLVLTATLKKVKGKYLKGKKVTFKFNGKKYVTKTNKKGVAKLTVPRYALYQIWVGKKVAYSATYGKDTIKRTAKVQR